MLNPIFFRHDFSHKAPENLDLYQIGIITAISNHRLNTKNPFGVDKRHKIF